MYGFLTCFKTPHCSTTFKYFKVSLRLPMAPIVRRWVDVFASPKWRAAGLEVPSEKTCFRRGYGVPWCPYVFLLKTNLQWDSVLRIRPVLCRKFVCFLISSGQKHGLSRGEMNLTGTVWYSSISLHLSHEVRVLGERNRCCMFMWSSVYL